MVRPQPISLDLHTLKLTRYKMHHSNCLVLLKMYNLVIPRHFQDTKKPTRGRFFINQSRIKSKITYEYVVLQACLLTDYGG